MYASAHAAFVILSETVHVSVYVSVLPLTTWTVSDRMTKAACASDKNNGQNNAMTGMTQ